MSVCERGLDDNLTDMKRTPIEFKNSWEKMKERTSNQRLHFGHFKKQHVLVL